MRKLILAVTVALSTFVMSAAVAAEARPVAEDPAVEARVQKLSDELRCLVCQNQNLSDSHADLALDLKRQVREMVKAGRSDREILDYMVQRYGDFVLYRPPVKATTWLLWAGPFVLFFGALALLFIKLRRRLAQQPQPLSADEHAAAERLLATGKE
ncbi:MAG: cytochrome c-type biogenesis protein [Candidatus Accumulibacter sp.]|uniref:cytochrome c-type biogenesis protein n=1 Tax=Accumulibacter sp. TaxID=2053492 RepID=UPI00287822E6|nr:cytochrome c-type biogenesis protein [Accumulibacter sp.]MDS4015254.1 cytochrome c-type biogenesis protein [Accumulibacter sp.]